MAQIGTDIAVAKKILEQGDLVGIPTETVYGLAGSAFDQQAVTKIFKVKNRPFFDPLIVHTYAWEQVTTFCYDIPKLALQLAANFWPGPLTLLLKRKDIIPDLVTAGSERVAVRVPKHPLTLDLLEHLDFPLAAPSANPFGYISPTTAQHVQDQLGEQISYILDGGSSEVGLESTIIGFDQKERPELYRLGGMSVETIELLTGELVNKIQSGSDPEAPGMLEKHYAPKKVFKVGTIDALLPNYSSDEVALLAWDKYRKEVKPAHQIVLSEHSDLEEAAQKLFSALRELDSLPVQTILADWVPNEGLGKAINDRLRRAAAQ
ncbi:MAG: L-threonylcarbamoyladenylate synthase [Cyclobacteriaceae bacterium]